MKTTHHSSLHSLYWKLTTILESSSSSGCRYLFYSWFCPCVHHNLPLIWRLITSSSKAHTKLTLGCTKRWSLFKLWNGKIIIQRAQAWSVFLYLPFLWLWADQTSLGSLVSSLPAGSGRNLWAFQRNQTLLWRWDGLGYWQRKVVSVGQGSNNLE